MELKTKLKDGDKTFKVKKKIDTEGAMSPILEIKFFILYNGMVEGMDEIKLCKEFLEKDMIEVPENEVDDVVNAEAWELEC